jgi:hypothetical protein
MLDCPSQEQNRDYPNFPLGEFGINTSFCCSSHERNKEKNVQGLKEEKDCETSRDIAHAESFHAIPRGKWTLSTE